MADDLTAKYALANDIDARDTASWEGGFEPVGPFEGIFDGQGFVIKGLTIDREDTRYIGLFQVIEENGVVRNVGLEDVNIRGDVYVGALVGSNLGTIEHSYSTGNVYAADTQAGGLAGRNEGLIMNSASSVDVEGPKGHLGGLVAGNPGTIIGSRSSGTVKGVTDYVGGLVSQNSITGEIIESYSTASVIGKNYIGGLAGDNNGGKIRESFSGGVVTGSSDLGGLVGLHRNNGEVKWSYSTTTVNGAGANTTGGLIGGIRDSGTVVTQSFSVGKVTMDPESTKNPGGLVGGSAGVVTLSYWDMDRSGLAVSAGGGTGITSEQMGDRGFWEELSGWEDIIDFGDGGADKVWRFYDGDEMPSLKALDVQSPV